MSELLYKEHAGPAVDDSLDFGNQTEERDKREPSATSRRMLKGWEAEFVSNVFIRLRFLLLTSRLRPGGSS